jgi:choline-sulfatase
VRGRPWRNNVVVVMVDQLAAGWLPAYGHEVVRAPNVTALAAQGVTFDAAYCPSPLCAPSRSAMLSGRFASRIGVFDNAAELPASVPTVAHHLRAAGYHTCLAGKMHFVGPDQLHGFEQRLTTDIYPAGVDWTPDWTRDVAQRLPWYHTMESVLTPARCVASMQTDYDDEVAFQSVRHIHDLARTRAEQPFLLVASFTSPHDPWEIPSRYWDLYDPDEIALPAVPKIALDDADPHSRRLRTMSGIDELELADEQIRRARHGYYAAISYVDERIGAVLDALRETGLDDGTAIIFTADHGEFLGERGLWYKMSFLEPSARVPLIVRPPGGGQPRRIAQPVSLLDLAPTLVELATGRDDRGSDLDLDGTSLAALIEGDEAAERPPVIAEYHAEGVTAPAAMVRDGRHKLIVCGDDPDQLYDLEADPFELDNLAGRSQCQETAVALRTALDRRLALGEIERRVLASQRDRRLVTLGMSNGELSSWDYQPRVDASMQYVRSRADLYDLQRRARLERRPSEQP